LALARVVTVSQVLVKTAVTFCAALIAIRQVDAVPVQPPPYLAKIESNRVPEAGDPHHLGADSGMLAVGKAEAEGKAKGKAEGEAKGKAEGLKRLLTRRFGRLPRWAIQRLDTAAMEQLDAWLEGIFDARSLEELIGKRG
jgi:hypothetical protein